MGAIEPRPIEILSEADAAAGLARSTEAGWNQTVADWLLFLRRGTVYGVRDPDGRVIATAAILPYGRTAWISLVLVKAAERRRGLARALMARCLAQADAAGWQTRLDATPDGAAVYAPLGFRPTDELVRYRRPSCSPPRQGVEIETSGPLLTLDREAFGLDRSALIHDLAARPDSAAWGDAAACCLVRDGRRARHIGPVYGREPEAVADLIGRVAAAEPGELIVDAYAGRERARTALETLGFAAERSFLRMVRGGEPPGRSPEVAVAGAGPEYG